MATASTDVIRRVFDDENDVCLEVGPSPEDTGHVDLRAEGDKNREWFGDIRLSMPKAFAAELGRALIAAAGEG